MSRTVAYPRRSDSVRVYWTCMELKERRLRKRSMYLVINQAMADIFVAASVISHCLYLGSDCEFWTIQYLSVLYSSVSFVSWIFPTASLINLAAISLERTPATFRSFEHRLFKKKVFGAVIAAVWITSHTCPIHPN